MLDDLEKMPAKVAALRKRWGWALALLALVGLALFAKGFLSKAGEMLAEKVANGLPPSLSPRSPLTSSPATRPDASPELPAAQAQRQVSADATRPVESSGATDDGSRQSAHAVRAPEPGRTRVRVVAKASSLPSSPRTSPAVQRAIEHQNDVR